LPSDFLSAALPAALFRFQDETIFSIEVNPPDGIAVVAMARHDAFEHIVITLMAGVRRVGMR